MAGINLPDSADRRENDLQISTGEVFRVKSDSRETVCAPAIDLGDHRALYGIPLTKNLYFSMR